MFLGFRTTTSNSIYPIFISSIGKNVETTVSCTERDDYPIISKYFHMEEEVSAAP